MRKFETGKEKPDLVFHFVVSLTVETKNVFVVFFFQTSER